MDALKNNREICQRKCFRTKEKETWVKFNPGLSANRPSNNWAQNFWLVYFKVICACRLQEPGKRIFIARPELYLCIDHYY